MTTEDDDEDDAVATRAQTRAWRPSDRSKVTLMQVFRQAHAERDARARADTAPGADIEVSARSQQRRIGMTEDALRTSLQIDLDALMNTVQLGSCVPLDDHPHVRRSIVNYGFRDLSSVSLQELRTADVVGSIRQSLLDHEPRFIPETLEVTLVGEASNPEDRLSIRIEAELMGDPVDVAVDFDAEIDLGAGKLRMSGLRVHA